MEASSTRKVDEGATSAEPARSVFILSRWLFLRLLGIVHLIAFVSLWTQIQGLVGQNGILPVSEYLTRAQDSLVDSYWRLPTLCWIDASDATLHALCAAGMVAALLLIGGVAPILALIVLWVTYLSLSVVGQAFLGFQWDSLLLETTFFAILFAPRSLWPKISREMPPSRLARWLLWWLLFKLMFLSGVTKLLSGDETWRELSAMNVHYQTQPIPNGISWFMHQLPEWWHQGEVVTMLAIEMGVPFLIFGPRVVRHAACLAIVLLQLGIEATGNYGFFNVLTITLCVPLLDDRLLRRLVPRRWTAWMPDAGERAKPRPRRQLTAAVLGLPLAVLWYFSFVAFVNEMVRTQNRAQLHRSVNTVLDGCDQYLLSWCVEPINHWVGPYRTFNGYGLFRVMTTERPEIVIAGSRDGITWSEYGFRWKPGNVGLPPRTVAPHQPRLDWQMWFAALNPRGNGYWLTSLMRHLLEGTPDVLDLLSDNPFPHEPPQFVRLTYYRYEFTDADTRERTGQWWQRTSLGPLTPAVSRQMFASDNN